MDITKQNREYLTTTNRSIYNKLRKEHLVQSKGLVSCIYCKYHRNENRDSKHYYYYERKKYDTYKVALNGDINQNPLPSDYGITWEWEKEYTHTVIFNRRPNWKLTSKSPKQYIKTKLIHEYSDFHISKMNEDYMYDYDIKW